MMSGLKTMLAAGALAAAAAASAQAADMPGLPPLAAPVGTAPLADVGTGWYLRGDVGYSWNQIDRTDTAAGFVAPGNNDWSAGAVLGGGAGIRMYRLRFDATFDIAPATAYTATSIQPGDVTAKIAASTAMFNGYIDICNWRGVTPYVGAGIGASYLTISNYASSVVPPFSPPLEHSRWNTAWALMAGLSYPVSPNVLVDIGYRYLSLGHAQTGFDSFGGLRLDNLSSQQIRIGARWVFNDLIPTP